MSEGALLASSQNSRPSGRTNTLLKSPKTYLPKSRGGLLASIDESTDDGESILVPILGDRVAQWFTARTGARAARRRRDRIEGIKAVESLDDHPAIVAPFLNDIDLLEEVLPDVCEKQPAVPSGPVVERKAVGISQAIVCASAVT